MIRVGHAPQNESVSLQDIQDAKYASSFMRDRASINIDGRTYTKIGKNEWQHLPPQQYAIGGIFSDKEIYDKVKSSKKCRLDESIENLNEAFIYIATHANGESKYRITSKDSRYVYFKNTLGTELRYDTKEQCVEQYENGKWDFYILQGEIAGVNIK